jgi:hypothetical protein
MARLPVETLAGVKLVRPLYTWRSEPQQIRGGDLYNPSVGHCIFVGGTALMATSLGPFVDDSFHMFPSWSRTACAAEWESQSNACE